MSIPKIKVCFSLEFPVVFKGVDDLVIKNYVFPFQLEEVFCGTEKNIGQWPGRCHCILIFLIVVTYYCLVFVSINLISR